MNEKIYDKETEKVVNNYLDILGEQVKKAEREYNDAINEITWKTNSTMFTITDINKMIQVVKDVRVISEELYATYEMVVRTIDGQCSMMEDKGISHKNLQDIASFIRGVNNKSCEIANDFSMSFDRSMSGDIGSLSYVASVEAKAIQKKWEMKYALHTECDEEKDERLKMEERIAEEKKKEQEEKAEAQKKEKEKYQKELEAWSAQAEEMKRLRESDKKETFIKYEEEAKRTREALASDKERQKKEVGEKINSIHLQVEEYKGELETLSILKFKRKKELTKLIEEKELEQKYLDDELKEIERKHVKKLSEINDKLKSDKEKLEREINKKYPIPESPEQRKKREERERQKAMFFKGEDGEVRAQILELLSDRKVRTISEMQSEDYAVGKYSNVKISNYLKELEMKGYVEKAVVKGRSYYAGTGKSY